MHDLWKDNVNIDQITMLVQNQRDEQMDSAFKQEMDKYDSEVMNKLRNSFQTKSIDLQKVNNDNTYLRHHGSVA